jgi:hypothetical protein
LQVPHVAGLVFADSQPTTMSQSRNPAAQPQLADPTQTLLSPQSLLQEPQVLASERSASQPSSGRLLHSAKPVTHTHSEFAHTSFAPQLIPQPPQFLESLVTSTSQPLSAEGSQLAVPAGHLQLPPTQVAPNGQRMPQLPQFSVSVATLASQPSPAAALRLQSKKPSAHALEHWPETQIVPGHPVPQALQFSRLTSRSAQVPSQHVSLAAQVVHETEASGPASPV